MKSVLLLSLLLALRCYAPSPLFFGQNPQAAPSGGLTLPTLSVGTYRLVLVADDLALGSVSSWASRVGGWSAAQGTTAKRPVAIANGFGTRIAVDFDGIDDVLEVASFNPGGTAGLTVFVVAAVNSSANFEIIAESNSNFDAAGTWNFYKDTGNGMAISSAGGSGTYSQFLTGSVVGQNITTGTYDRSLSSNENTGWVNGTSSGTRPLNVNLSGTFQTYTLFLGARAGTSLFFTGNLAALIVVSGPPDTTERQSIEAVLDAYY